jgi:hypothetical protein
MPRYSTEKTTAIEPTNCESALIASQLMLALLAVESSNVKTLNRTHLIHGSADRQLAKYSATVSSSFNNVLV